jgi:hypothetical protein
MIQKTGDCGKIFPENIGNKSRRIWGNNSGCIGRTVLGFATGEMFHKTALLK